MKAVIGRACNGWSTTGFVALMEDETVVAAGSAKELMIQLQARGIKEHDLVLSDANDGDHSLSPAQQADLRAAWLAVSPD